MIRKKISPLINIKANRPELHGILWLLKESGGRNAKIGQSPAIHDTATTTTREDS